MPKGFTQPDWLMQAAAEKPDALAIVHDNVSWDYETLNIYAGFNAAGLSALGVKAGSCVGILLPNCIEYVALVWAIWRLGATVVPLNLRLTVEELAYQVGAAGCERVIVEAGMPGAYFTSLGVPTEPFEPYYGITTFKEVDDEAHDFDRWGQGEFTRQSIALVVFTSGTSGRPKGAQLTFNNLYYAAMASTLRLGNEANDRWLLSLPLYHVGGLAMIVRACLSRVPLIVLDRFEAERVAAAAAAHAATLVSLVPTMLHRLLRETTGNPFPASVRLVLIGGAALTPELAAAALERGIPIAPTYGLTEAGSQVCTALPDEARAKPGAVGKALPFMRVRVIDGQGSALPPGKVGEVVVQGPNVMFGYVGDVPPDIPLTKWGTPERLPYQDGYRTGDLGYLDDDGELFLVQRRSDLIVTGGENVYPAEVERVLASHPAVREVAVVGVADAEWGQRIGAVIAVVIQFEALKHEGTEGTEVHGGGIGVTPQMATEREAARKSLQGASTASRDDLIVILDAYARQHLAGYKVPRAWRIVDALPLTGSGKVDRAAVRALFNPD
jgi:o-succinylbenzoate---CoA ligase